ncbi:hypothetical protein L9F63_015430, partial [Diploptera punctata]
EIELSFIARMFTRLQNLSVSNLTNRLKCLNSVVCYCDGHCPDDKPNGTCIGQPGSHCFSAVEEIYNIETGVFEEERTYGCLPPDESGFMQ